VKKLEKCDVTYSWTPVTNCHTFSDPSPVERDVLYGRPQISLHSYSTNLYPTRYTQVIRLSRIVCIQNNTRCLCCI